MIAPLTLSQIAHFCAESENGKSLHAQLMHGDATFTRVNTDTRTLAAGDLFVALRGERFDAHNFLSQAFEKKVCGLVVEKYAEDIPLPQLVVKDTLHALGQIAALNRAAYTKPLLAITGSGGKTTVKTMLAAILSQCGNVLATLGNLNNHIGVPLTLLRIDSQHDYAVIEMGASAIGEIAYLCSLAKPQVAMVNNVMPAHIQGFGSIDGVAKAKGEIYQALSSQNIAVVNIDDRYSDTWLATLPSKVIRVSLNNQNADCYASSIEYATEFVQFELHIRGEVKSISLQALGEHNVRNALMAAAMAFSVGASLEKIRDGLALFSPVSGRMTSRVGIKGAKIIDDSYNANPGSVRAAIDVLASRDGHRILVLGDLGELGPEAEQQHFDLGIYAQNKKIEGVFTLGNLSRHASLAFASATSAHYESRDLLIETLKDIANPNTTFLIKGSRSAKMELVVNALCSAQETSTGDSH